MRWREEAEHMEATVIESATNASDRTLIDRLREALSAQGCSRVWTRGAGRHVLLGLPGEEAFARVTALGAGSYGLAFQGGIERRWELLLVDDLRNVVEHALVGGSALPAD
jgi:hypothetical protein